MLSSIHPLGERARNNRWGVTVAAMTIGSIGAGTLLGFALGGLGSFLPVAGEPAGLLVVGAAAVAAGAADLRKVPIPSTHRQVNETWIGPYRGWVYGGAFGVQLGSGVATYVVTWGVYATLLAAFLSGSALAGAIIGGLFGAGRALLPLAAGWIDRPSRLSAFHMRMADWARPAARLAGVGLAVAGVALVVLGAVPA